MYQWEGWALSFVNRFKAIPKPSADQEVSNAAIVVLQEKSGALKACPCRLSTLISMALASHILNGFVCQCMFLWDFAEVADAAPSLRALRGAAGLYSTVHAARMAAMQRASITSKLDGRWLHEAILHTLLWRNNLMLHAALQNALRPGTLMMLHAAECNTAYCTAVGQSLMLHAILL
eukprot:scaffold11643_cov20-Tisochrysis_lutea.AAC.6